MYVCMNVMCVKVSIKARRYWIPGAWNPSWSFGKAVSALTHGAIFPHWSLMVLFYARFQSLMS